MGIISSNPQKQALAHEPAYYYDKHYGEGSRSSVLLNSKLASRERYSLIPSMLKKKSELLDHIDLKYPFIYGPIATSSLAFFSSIIVIKKFRNFFELGSKGRFATFSTVCLPSFLINLGLNYYLDSFHNKFFNTQPNVYYKKDSQENASLVEKQPCPLCYEVRASLVQITSALIWPVLFSPIICGYVSTVLNLKPLPSIHFSISNIKSMLKFYFISPLSTSLEYNAKNSNIKQKSGNSKFKYFWAFLGVQIIMAMILKEYQIKKAIEIEEKLNCKLKL